MLIMIFFPFEGSTTVHTQMSLFFLYVWEFCLCTGWNMFSTRWKKCELHFALWTRISFYIFMSVHMTFIMNSIHKATPTNGTCIFKNTLMFQKVSVQAISRQQMFTTNVTNSVDFLASHFLFRNFSLFISITTSACLYRLICYFVFSWFTDIFTRSCKTYALSRRGRIWTFSNVP